MGTLPTHRRGAVSSSPHSHRALRERRLVLLRRHVRLPRARLSLAVLAGACIAMQACSLRDRIPGGAGPCTRVWPWTTSIPFTRVDFETRSARQGRDFLPGVAYEGVVRDSAAWASLWPRVAENTPRPEIPFADSALIVVASREFASGPERVEIEDVRRCRRSGATVVYTRVHTSQMKLEAPDRSVVGVLVPRSAVAAGEPVFVALPADDFP